MVLKLIRLTTTPNGTCTYIRGSEESPNRFCSARRYRRADATRYYYTANMYSFNTTLSDLLAFERMFLTHLDSNRANEGGTCSNIK
jgi:hypothetical protein